jgi:hypothetical protein
MKFRKRTVLLSLRLRVAEKTKGLRFEAAHDFLHWVDDLLAKSCSPHTQIPIRQTVTHLGSLLSEEMPFAAMLVHPNGETRVALRVNLACRKQKAEFPRGAQDPFSISQPVTFRD